MVSPAGRRFGPAWGRVGAVTSELWALRAIHRTAAATDSSSRSNDSKTAAIPVQALGGDCAGAGAGAPQAPGGRGDRWAAGCRGRDQGGGAGPGRDRDRDLGRRQRRFSRLRLRPGFGSRPRMGPRFPTRGTVVPQVQRTTIGEARPRQLWPEGDLPGLGDAAGETKGPGERPDGKGERFSREDAYIFYDKHILFFQESF